MDVVYTRNGIFIPQRKDILTERYGMGELEDMMLGAVSQSQKDRYCVTALT